MRAARLRAKGDRMLESFLDSKLNTSVEILMETGGKARTEQFTPVRLDGYAAG